MEADAASMISRVDQFLEGLDLVLKHHDCPSEVRSSFEKQAKDYLSNVPEMVFVKRAKHLTLCPIALLLGNELPAVPDLDFFPQGKWKRWYRPRITFYRRKNVHLWYSFLQGKRGAAPLSPEVILENLRKHRVSMLSVDQLAAGVNPQGKIVLDWALELLEPLMVKLDKGCSRGLKEIVKSPGGLRFCPSMSASLDSSRSQGGQRGELIAALESIRGLDRHHHRDRLAFHEERLIDPTFDDEVINEPAFQGLDDRPELLHEHQIRGSDPYWFDTLMLTSDLHMMEQESRFIRVDDRNLRKTVGESRGNLELEELVQDLVEERLASEKLEVIGVKPNTRLTAKVGFILEPLKVRTITKGPAVPYYIGKSVQKTIHNCLRKIPAFRLIGRPFCVTDLIDLRVVQDELDWWHHDKIGEEREQLWLSIDYSAATDEISATLSRHILSRILRSILTEKPELYHLLMKILAPHDIIYPEVDGETVESVRQTNGQLMGSILSFPVLCIANLALFLFVRAQTMPRARYHDLIKAVLVNGDDMIYIGTREEWALHQKYGLLFGLRVTPGKAYIHHRYANVNSVSVDYDLTQEDSLPEKVGFLNVGLMLGMNKVMEVSKESQKDKVEWETPRVSTIDEVISGAYYPKRAEVMKQFLSRHKEEIKKECRGRNLFIPISLGGMGVTPVPSFLFHITDKQRKVANKFASYPGVVIDTRPYQFGERFRIPRNGVPLREELGVDRNLFRDRTTDASPAKQLESASPLGRAITRGRVLLL